MVLADFKATDSRTLLWNEEEERKNWEDKKKISKN